jgi:hypothetical protein
VRLGVRAAIALTGLILATGFPASGQLTFNGVCTLNVTFFFSSPITLNSQPASWSMTGTGTCVTDQGPLSPVKTMSLNGSGPPSQQMQCDDLRILGSYGISFLPSPAPPPSSGALDFIGTAAGGVLHLSSTTPQFQGLGVLVSLGALSCVSGGATQMTFTGVFVFVDP